METLKLWASIGLICLKYLDESGCYCHSTTDYTYAPRGQQKRRKQSRKRGRRINILGVWEPLVSFDYALMLGTLNTQTFLEIINWQAQKAQDILALTRVLTVIVLDNASVHRSKLTREHFQHWYDQGLILFFLPPYNPQMNRIEDEWLHLKRDELASRVFEDEYDLAIAIMSGIKNRATQSGYSVERFTFN
ncbi:MAG: transposase [Heteroscytonema crispum UTEX LB 1556]